MFKATQNNLPTDVAIFSAAVADFKIKEKKREKIRQEAQDMVEEYKNNSEIIELANFEEDIVEY